jgi:hypothetical protein
MAELKKKLNLTHVTYRIENDSSNVIEKCLSNILYINYAALSTAIDILQIWNVKEKRTINSCVLYWALLYGMRYCK